MMPMVAHVSPLSANDLPLRLLLVTSAASALFFAAGCNQGGAVAKPDSAPASSPELGKDYSALVAVVEPAVVRIDVETESGKAIGSGFVVSEDGITVTNYHVIEGARSATATFNKGETAPIPGILATDQERDVAILKLKLPGKLGFVPVSHEAARKGEPVLAIGTPKGLSFTVTEGIVSAIRAGGELQDYGGSPAGTWIQTSAPISSGNSGGPLLNMAGKVVGMNTLAFKNAQNLNFAISAADILDVLEKAKTAAITPFTSSQQATPEKPGRATSQPAKHDHDDSTGLAQRHDLEQSLKTQREFRIKQIQHHESNLKIAKQDLKSAMMAGDVKREATHRGEIRSSKQSIREIIDKSRNPERLSLLALKSSQVGTPAGWKIKVFQVIDKGSGECLARADERSGRHDESRTIWFKRMNLNDIADDQPVTFSDQDVFAVLGTTTYESRTGPRTVFVLAPFPDYAEFASITSDQPAEKDEPDFTPDEAATVANLKKQADEAQAEAERVKAETKAAQKAEADKEAAAQKLAKEEKVAQAKLKLANDFLKSGKSDAYRKTLKDLIEKYPDTKAAEKARKAIK